MIKEIRSCELRNPSVGQTGKHTHTHTHTLTHTHTHAVPSVGSYLISAPIEPVVPIITAMCSKKGPRVVNFDPAQLLYFSQQEVTDVFTITHARNHTLTFTLMFGQA